MRDELKARSKSTPFGKICQSLMTKRVFGLLLSLGYVLPLEIAPFCTSLKLRTTGRKHDPKVRMGYIGIKNGKPVLKEEVEG